MSCTGTDLDNEENVRVSVRVRPLSQKECEKNCCSVVSVDQIAKRIDLTRPEVFGLNREQKSFTFDAVFPQETNQAEIYNHVARPIINYVLEGYNGTIFAYGQTGTGKTYTMDGDHNVPELKGIIPNSFAQIFNHISQASEDTRFLVRVSYLEIYNEEVRDLLSKNILKKLEIRENKDVGVYVQDLSSFVVRNENDMTKIMKIGNKSRSVAETNMNVESSRSHAIFSIVLECSTEHKDGEKTFRMGKLNLVDLAGSERISKTGTTGQRLKEGAKINMSLSNLGNVISALVDGHPHIPYRSSKLTRLLQDSLGGNSKTVMIANIGPADYNYEETLSTLRYADRAKHIKNHAIINEDPKDALLRKFEDEIELLKRQLCEEQEEVDQPEFYAEESYDESADYEHHQSNSVPGENDTLVSGIKHELENQEKISSEFEAESRNKKSTLRALRENVLSWKEHEARKAKLEEKLKSIQKKIMVGGENLLEKSQEQEEFLHRSMTELGNRRKEQEKLQDILSSKTVEKAELEQDVLKLQAELNVLDKTLVKNLRTLKRERRKDAILKYEEKTEKDLLLEEVRKACWENRKLEMLLESYVPKEIYPLIESSITFNEETEEFQIPGIEFAGNNVAQIYKISRSYDQKVKKSLDFLYKTLESNGNSGDGNAYINVEPVRTEDLKAKTTGKLNRAKRDPSKLSTSKTGQS